MLKELIDRPLTSVAGGCERNYNDKLCLISVDLTKKSYYTPVSFAQ